MLRTTWALLMVLIPALRADEWIAITASSPASQTAAELRSCLVRLGFQPQDTGDAFQGALLRRASAQQHHLLIDLAVAKDPGGSDPIMTIIDYRTARIQLMEAHASPAPDAFRCDALLARSCGHAEGARSDGGGCGLTDFSHLLPQSRRLAILLCSQVVADARIAAVDRARLKAVIQLQDLFLAGTLGVTTNLSGRITPARTVLHFADADGGGLLVRVGDVPTGKTVLRQVLRGEKELADLVRLIADR